MNDPNNFTILQPLLVGGLIMNLYTKIRSVSSVGLEHRLDRAGVVGSNPIHSTRKKPRHRCGFVFEGSYAELVWRKMTENRKQF